MADVDLQEFAQACKAFGFEVFLTSSPRLDAESNVYRVPSVEIGPINYRVIWDGTNENWELTGLLVGAIKAKVAELNKKRVEHGLTFQDMKVHDEGDYFLSKGIERLTTTLAATALLEMWKAAEVRGG